MKQSFLFKRGKIWQLQYLDEEENRIKRVSTKCESKSDALKFLTEFKLKEENANKEIFIKLFKFSSEYENYIQTNFSRNYFKDVRTTFRFLKPFIGDIPLKKISPYQLEKFLGSIYKESKFAAKHHFNNLRSAFNKAIVWDYLQQNPLQKIKPPKVPRNNPSFLNEIELKLILSNESDTTLKNIYQFAFYTGMRLGEIVNLKWDHISLSERNIRIVNSDEFTTKGQRERVVPINNRVFEILKGIAPRIFEIQKKNYVFNKSGFKYNPDYISKAFKKAIIESSKDSSINPTIHFHDLRHSFASNLVQRGASLYVIKELLGHRDIKTTMIYAHLQAENLRNAMDLLN